MGTRDVYRMYDYYDAEEVFKKRDAVRSHRWQSNWRPAVSGKSGTRYIYIRLEKRSNHYALVLHKTTLLKFFEPSGNGYARTEVYLPSAWNTASTRAVLSSAGWLGGRYGMRVSPSKENDGLSMVLVTKDGQRVLEHSHELRLYKRCSTEDDKQKRNIVIETIKPLMIMGEMWMMEELDRLCQRHEALQKNPTPSVNNWSDFKRPRNRLQGYEQWALLKALEDQTEPDENHLNHFKELCELVVFDATKLEYSYERQGWKMGPRPTIGELRSSLRARLIKGFSLQSGSGRIYLEKGEPFEKGRYFTTGYFPEGVDPRADSVGAVAQAEEGAGSETES